MKSQQMNDAIYSLSDPINVYSLIHFLEYGLLSLISFIKPIHVLIISISWEIIELFIQQEWARESGFNKAFDIVFNFSGYFFGRFLFRSILAKKSISN